MSNEVVKTSEQDFLRGDYPCSIVMESKTYPSLEHAYQAAKVLDLDDDVRDRIADAGTAREALDIGRERGIEIWPDWDERRVRVREYLTRQKFLASSALSEQLVATGEADILMDRHEDSFWGIGEDGLGANREGKILMAVRDEINLTTGKWKRPEKEECEAVEDARPGEWLLERWEDAELSDPEFELIVQMYENVKRLIDMLGEKDQPKPSPEPTSNVLFSLKELMNLKENKDQENEEPPSEARKGIISNLKEILNKLEGDDDAEGDKDCDGQTWQDYRFM